MSFVRCGTHAHWGQYGAAGLLLTTPQRDAVLLQLRSRMVLAPNTWALPGGALEPGETPTDAALREAHEEVGLDAATLRVELTLPGLTHASWRYTYVLATTDSRELPIHTSWEVADHRWFSLSDVPDLHPELDRDWSRITGALRDGH